MPVNGVTAAADTNTGQTATMSRQLDRDAFLKLLVSQLKYQDPTKPMEDREFIAQLAQFSALEQMTNVSKGLEALLYQQEANQALSLIGKQVTVQMDPASPAVNGTVDEALFTSSGAVVVVNGVRYPVTSVLTARSS